MIGRGGVGGTGLGCDAFNGSGAGGAGAGGTSNNAIDCCSVTGTCRPGHINMARKPTWTATVNISGSDRTRPAALKPSDQTGFGHNRGHP